MKFKLLSVLLLLATYVSTAQHNDLLDVNWELISLDFQDENYDIAQEDIDYPGIIFYDDNPTIPSSGEAYEIFGFCGGGNAELMYNASVSFLVENEVTETNTCNMEEAPFDGAYFSFFTVGSGIINYTIEDVVHGRQRLTLTNSLNDVAVFNNRVGVSPENGELLGLWYLHEYDTRLGSGDPVPTTTPQIDPFIEFTEDNPNNFRGNFGCRDFTGSIVHFNSQDAFSNLSFSAEEGSCTDDVANDFEADFYENFFEFDDNELGLSYTIYDDENGNRTLNISHPFEYYAIYKRFSTLGLAENSNLKFTIFPNPVEDVLNISTEARVDNVTIYTLQGKVVYEQAHVDAIVVQSLTSGVYFVEVTIQGQSSVKRIIKL